MVNRTRMPSELQRLIQPFLQVFEAVSLLDENCPDTSITKMKAEFCKISSEFQKKPPLSINALKLLSEKSQLLKTRTALQEASKNLKKDASRDPRYSLLIKLIEEADAKVPLVSILALGPYLSIVEYWRTSARLSKVLRKLREMKSGELRADKAIEAAWMISEPLYLSYLHCLWKLSFLKDGKPWKNFPKYGALVKQLSTKLADYPGLVQPFAGELRNAACHGFWRFCPDDDSLLLWDENIPAKKWAVRKLISISEKMFQISAETVFSVALLYGTRNFLLRSGCFDLLIEFIDRISFKEMPVDSNTEEEFKLRLTRIFAPLNSFSSASFENSPVKHHVNQET